MTRHVLVHIKRSSGIDSAKNVKQAEDPDNVKLTEKSAETPNTQSVSTAPGSSEPAKPDGKSTSASSSPAEDEFDILSKRFAQLKKR